MYSDFIFYLSKYIDKEEFTIISIEMERKWKRWKDKP